MQQEYVEQRDGFYYIAGTRVSLDSLVHAFQEGESPETIRQNFETLSLVQVYGAITFYLEHQRRIDDYLTVQQQRIDQMRQAAGTLPEDLRDRLAKARSQLHVGSE